MDTSARITGSPRTPHTFAMPAARVRPQPGAVPAPVNVSALRPLRSGGGARAWGECMAGELPSYSAGTVDTVWVALSEGSRRAWGPYGTGDTRDGRLERWPRSTHLARLDALNVMILEVPHERATPASPSIKRSSPT
jgi:hypothetical protein